MMRSAESAVEKVTVSAALLTIGCHIFSFDA
jgi:hypothetical protein